MKKKLSAALALAAILTLTACSREEIPFDIPAVKTESENSEAYSESEYAETAASTEAAKETAETEAEKTEPAETTAKTTAETTAETTAAAEPPATAPAATEAPEPQWIETAVAPTTMYINSQGVYSRIKPIQGSTKVTALGYNRAVTVTAKTNTDYFKIEDGSYVHSSFLNSEKAAVTTTAAPVVTDPPVTVAEAAPEIIGQYDQRRQTQAEIDFANKLFDLTNAERKKAGLPEFKKMQVITEKANIRAWELTISATHQRPDGSACGSVLDGIPYSAIGENLAAGQATPEDVLDAWMNSDGHRANILSTDYEYLGIGYYNVSGTTYTNHWIQIFYK
ncbi:MAG: CAP domain-containing protein [Firmicutes bacterium]|nr:CAP domain-containing protein [[Eubacterium] siraeum]MCM1486882.1 CAP domain-containing protein [Bacillota bacterium]